MSHIHQYSKTIAMWSCRAYSAYTGSISSSLDMGERSGLILGVHSFEGDLSDMSMILTPSGERLDMRLGGIIRQNLMIARPIPKLGEAKVFYGLDRKYVAMAVVGLGDDCKGYNPVEQLDERKEAIRTAVAVGVKALANVGVPRIFVDSCEHAESAAEGASLGSWMFQELKDVSKRKVIQRLELFDCCDSTGWKIGLHKAAAQNLTRLLQETPGNNLTPCIFAQTVIEMLSKYGISVNVRMKNWAELRNLNGFLAVAKGACEPPVLLEIIYEGCTTDVCPIVIIGKGVTYNSGGICLRNCKQLIHGRGDMVGAASIVATFRAIAALNLPINVLGLLPLCANLPGARAYKPGDVVRSHNGKTILVDDTNCEGLLMHADVLSFSGEYNPKLILDVGTLSPDMVGAMSTTASGVFSNCDSLYEVMRVSSIHTGDRIWRFPLWEYFKNYMKTKTSDFTNKSPRSIGGGACKTAAFLEEFVPHGVDWIHVDGYNVYRSNGIDYSYLGPGFSGRPTRNLIEFLAQLSCRADCCNQ